MPSSIPARSPPPHSPPSPWAASAPLLLPWWSPAPSSRRSSVAGDNGCDPSDVRPPSTVSPDSPIVSGGAHGRPPGSPSSHSSWSLHPPSALTSSSSEPTPCPQHHRPDTPRVSSMPISGSVRPPSMSSLPKDLQRPVPRSEEHTSELQSL